MTIYVVYHSGYGHTKLQAEAIARGAGAELMPVEDVDFEKLATADAIIFGAPTYMGSVSAQFKTFMDASSKQWLQGKWKNKVAGGFTNSGSMSGDKLNSLIQLAIFAAQNGMIWVGAEYDAEGDRIGSTLGVMAQSGNSPADENNPHPKDIARAEQYGKRIAIITAKLKV
jgi:NAD(P)H dehydrogenase (quinone)